MPSHEYLQKLLKKRHQFDARIASTRAKIKKKEQRKETRKKVLIGSYFIEKFEKEKKSDELKLIMADYLTRESDRKLFGLAKGESK